MPTYEYRCAKGHEFEATLSVADYQTPQSCECGSPGRRIISVPALAFGQRECRYDSPVDGKPVTTWAQRRDDLARNGCQEYDPEMKKDVDRRIARESATLERNIERTVESEIERMPVRKREKLDQELRGGADAQPVRGAVPFKTTRRIDHA